MKKTVMIALFAALGLAAGGATAGYLQPSPVTVELNPDGSGTAKGDMWTARNADNDVDFIGCGLRSFNDGQGNVWQWGFCNSNNAAGEQGICFTENRALLDEMRAMSDTSFVIFTWNADGECTFVGYSTQSFYLPDMEKVKEDKKTK